MVRALVANALFVFMTLPVAGGAPLPATDRLPVEPRLGRPGVMAPFVEARMGSDDAERRNEESAMTGEGRAGRGGCGDGIDPTVTIEVRDEVDDAARMLGSDATAES
jgi:hypothetical protein